MVARKAPFMNNISATAYHLSVANTSSWGWSGGSALAFLLFTQLTTGMILSMNYIPDSEYAFSSIVHIMEDVGGGWLFRLIHMNGASMFFVCLYAHLSRGIYYASYKMPLVWLTGIMILVLSMGAAFSGYILVWGQMSFWGVTVITNMVSVIPYIGNSLVTWIWGDFSVGHSTLNRFFSFHFLIPMALSGFALAHMLLLHLSGSNSPAPIKSPSLKGNFTPNFSFKDTLGFLFIFMLFFYLIFYTPYLLGDPDNFSPANPLFAPPHIKPEWYFLWAYAMLRSVPSKLGGVVLMFSSIVFIAALPWLKGGPMMSKNTSRALFWVFIANIIVLSAIGGAPAEDPYIELGQLCSFLFFTSLLTASWFSKA